MEQTPGMGQVSIAQAQQAQIDKIKSEQAKMLAEMYQKHLISMEELQRATGMAPIGPTIKGNRVSTSTGYMPSPPSKPVISTDEEKVEVMSRITKAWLQMPSDISFMDVLWYITAPLSSHSLPNKDLAKLFEEYVEAAKRQSLSRQYEEAMNKMTSTIERDPKAAEDLVRKFVDLVK